jgi:putative selenate reductase molybdopterin-binding subunit
MNINLLINGIEHNVDVLPEESLLKALRSLGFFGVKFGSEGGETGADTVLIDGKPKNAGVMLAAQAEGHMIATIEALGENPEMGWKPSMGLHPLQRAFIETGAIQCGYCTPGQILTAKELLERQPNPTEAEIRDALSGVLCRCTGYLKPVQAVFRAAAVMRGEPVDPIVGTPRIPAPHEWVLDPDIGTPNGSEGDLLPGVKTRARVMPRIHVTPETKTFKSVGKR